MSRDSVIALAALAVVTFSTYLVQPHHFCFDHSVGRVCLLYLGQFHYACLYTLVSALLTLLGLP